MTTESIYFCFRPFFSYWTRSKLTYSQHLRMRNTCFYFENISQNSIEMRFSASCHPSMYQHPIRQTFSLQYMLTEIGTIVFLHRPCEKPREREKKRENKLQRYLSTFVVCFWTLPAKVLLRLLKIITRLFSSGVNFDIYKRKKCACHLNFLNIPTAHDDSASRQKWKRKNPWLFFLFEQ